jgi:hypothetical protein
MKEIEYKSGKVAGKTMAVKDLIIELSKYDKNMPVYCECQGIYGFIDEQSVCTDNGFKDECLVIYYERFN